MIPVDQTKLGHPEGDCFSACIASILEIPLEDVPNPKGEDWVHRFNEWLRDYGLAIVTMGLPEGAKDMPLDMRRYFLPGYCILAVKSPRGDWTHAVVCLDGEIVHDPHPQRDMGVGDWVEVDHLIPLDPKVVAQKYRP